MLQLILIIKIQNWSSNLKIGVRISQFLILALKLSIMNYGHFSKDGKEYVIDNVATPRPWINYIYKRSKCQVPAFFLPTGMKIATKALRHKVTPRVIIIMRFLVNLGVLESWWQFSFYKCFYNNRF